MMPQGFQIPDGYLVIFPGLLPYPIAADADSLSNPTSTAYGTVQGGSPIAIRQSLCRSGSEGTPMKEKTFRALVFCASRSSRDAAGRS